MSKSKRVKPDEIKVLAIDHIEPSPENDGIYGAINLKDDEMIELVESIRTKGQLEPIRISLDYFIVSGHRRYAACKRLGLETIKVVEVPIFRSDYDDVGWQKELRQWNRQRHKSTAVRLKEAILDFNPDVAYQRLQIEREQGDKDIEGNAIAIDGETVRSRITGAKMPMLNACIDVINSMLNYWPTTVRQIHYGLLNDPPLIHAKKPDSTYRNNLASYKNLCDLLARARLDGSIPFHCIADETRPRRNLRFPVDVAKFFASESSSFLSGYRRDLLQSQLSHFELIVEKQTALNIVQPVASKFCMPLTIGRGYCSLEPRYRIAERFKQSGKNKLVLLICSDLDPDGDGIAHSLARSIRDDFQIEDVEAYKALLTFDQVREWKIPPNEMEAKADSSRFKTYVAEHGTKDVYELEAIPPAKMQDALTEFILSAVDVKSYNAEVAAERLESAKIAAMRQHIAEEMSSLM